MLREVVVVSAVRTPIELVTMIIGGGQGIAAIFERM
jgi:acetyl-CoA acetyltransferase